MNYEVSIERCKNEIKEYSKDVSHNDLVWLKDKIISHYKEDINSSKTENEKEYTILSRLSDILYSIYKKKPSDIKAYVEKKLKKQEYDKKIKSLMSRAGSLHLGDEEKCDQIEQELKNLLTEADNEFPDFSEEYGRFASEIRMDLMAVRTGGKRGSSRMIMKLLGQRMEKEMNEKTEK